MLKSNIIAFENPKSPISEAYRTLRSNIQFSSFDNKIQTIVITSSSPGEGKTTTATNLAVTMSQAGYKTIIVDCDLRKPKIHRMFNISNEKGLSDILVGEDSLETTIQRINTENLHVLTSGTKPPNPAELLASKKMMAFLEILKQEYEYIILDTPPIIMVTDAQIISQYSDGCLLIVSSCEADKEAAKKSKQLLEKVNAKILGVVLNKMDAAKSKNYYSYYYNYYYYSENGEKE